MRSIYIYLKDATNQQVCEYLQNTYTFQSGPPWIYEINGEPYLYINVDENMSLGYESEEWQNIVNGFGEVPKIAVIADVSGRHPGDKQVRHFVTSLLKSFSGLALDEYTLHLWTWEQIESNVVIQSHPFFDYNGWYLEEKNKSS